MRLTAQASFDHVFDRDERRRMSSMFQGLENGVAVLTREIELPAGARIEIVRDDTIDLRTEWLDGHCEGLAFTSWLGSGYWYLFWISGPSACRCLR